MAGLRFCAVRCDLAELTLRGQIDPSLHLRQWPLSDVVTRAGLVFNSLEVMSASLEFLASLFDMRQAALQAII